MKSVAEQLLTSSMVAKQRQAKAVNLLQSWMDEEDGSEQEETGQYLIQALDEDRLSVGEASPSENRKLFPLEMKGSIHQLICM